MIFCKCGSISKYQIQYESFSLNCLQLNIQHFAKSCLISVNLNITFFTLLSKNKCHFFKIRITQFRWKMKNDLLGKLPYLMNLKTKLPQIFLLKTQKNHATIEVTILELFLFSISIESLNRTCEITDKSDLAVKNYTFCIFGIYLISTFMHNLHKL